MSSPDKKDPMSLVPCDLCPLRRAESGQRQRRVSGDTRRAPRGQAMRVAREGARRLFLARSPSSGPREAAPGEGPGGKRLLDSRTSVPGRLPSPTVRFAARPPFTPTPVGPVTGLSGRGRRSVGTRVSGVTAKPRRRGWCRNRNPSAAGLGETPDVEMTNVFMKGWPVIHPERGARRGRPSPDA